MVNLIAHITAHHDWISRLHFMAVQTVYTLTAVDKTSWRNSYQIELDLQQLCLWEQQQQQRWRRVNNMTKQLYMYSHITEASVMRTTRLPRSVLMIAYYKGVLKRKKRVKQIQFPWMHAWVTGKDSKMLFNADTWWWSQLLWSFCWFSTSIE